MSRAASTTPKRGFAAIQNGYPGPPTKRGGAFPFGAYDKVPALTGMGPIGSSDQLQGVSRHTSVQDMGVIATAGGDDRQSPLGVNGVPQDPQTIPELPDGTQFIRGEVVFNLKRPKATVLSLSMLNHLFVAAHKMRVESLKRMVDFLEAENVLKPEQLAFDEGGRSSHPDRLGVVAWLASLQTADQVHANIFPLGFYKDNSNTTYQKAGLLASGSQFSYHSTVSYESFGDTEDVQNPCNARIGETVFLVLFRNHPRGLGEPLSLRDNYGPWQFKLVSSRERTLPAFQRNLDLVAATHLYHHRGRPLRTAGEMIATKMELDAGPRKLPIEWVDQSERPFSTQCVRFTDLRFVYYPATKQLVAHEVSNTPLFFCLGEVALENLYSDGALSYEQVVQLQTDPTGLLAMQLGFTMRLKFLMRPVN